MRPVPALAGGSRGLVELRVDQSGGADSRAVLPGRDVRACLLLPDGTALAGTLDDGLWRRGVPGGGDDGSGSDGGWVRVPGPLADARVTALAFGLGEGDPTAGVVWAGTEPSRVFRSGDRGSTWTERPGLADLPSASGWSYPPRPDTHHVRSLAPRPGAPDHLLVGIEAGAVVRTDDGGESWVDRTPEGPRDPHALRVHPGAPLRIRAAAGDGWFESEDGGNSWTSREDGLGRTYVWDAAILPGDPGTVVAVSARNASEAHGSVEGRSRVWRREDGGPWQPAETGLPPRALSRAPALAPLHHEPAGVLLLSRAGALFRSRDGGDHWEEIRSPDGSGESGDDLVHLATGDPDPTPAP